MLYRFFIGSNNDTKKLEMKKAVGIVSRRFEGLTAYKTTGYWQGKPEKSLVIEVETANGRGIRLTAKELCKGLKQQAVGLAATGKMTFIN